MSTSGSTNFSVTRNDLISGALRIVGAISQGETPTASQISEAASALNFLAKAWQADGMPLWATNQYTITMTATNVFRIGTGQTINTPKPLKIIQAFLRDTSTNVDIPMRIITRDEYNRLGNKSSTGQPIQIYYDVQNTYGDLYVFPTPDSTSVSNKRIIIVYQRPFEDFDASTDEPDFPQEWFDALKHGLADRLAPEYGVSIVDRNDIARRAQTLKAEALSFGTEEGSLFFGVDRRNL